MFAANVDIDHISSSSKGKAGGIVYWRIAMSGCSGNVVPYSYQVRVRYTGRSILQHGEESEIRPFQKKKLSTYIHLLSTYSTNEHSKPQTSKIACCTSKSACILHRGLLRINDKVLRSLVAVRTQVIKG